MAFRSSKVLNELFVQFKSQRGNEKEKPPIKAIIAHPEAPRSGGLLPTKKVTLDSYSMLLPKVVG